MTTSNANKRLDKIESDLSASGLADEPSAWEIAHAEKVKRQNEHWFNCINKALHLWPDSHRGALVEELEAYITREGELPKSWWGLGWNNGFSVATNAVLEVASNLDRKEHYHTMPIPPALCDWFAAEPDRDFRQISHSEHLAGEKENWRWLFCSVHCLGCGLPLPSRNAHGRDRVAAIVATGAPDAERLPFVICPACNSNEIGWTIQDNFLSERPDH